MKMARKIFYSPPVHCNLPGLVFIGFIRHIFHRWKNFSSPPARPHKSLLFIISKSLMAQVDVGVGGAGVWPSNQSDQVFAKNFSLNGFLSVMSQGDQIGRIFALWVIFYIR
jgi:hypothetical protein